MDTIEGVGTLGSEYESRVGCRGRYCLLSEMFVVGLGKSLVSERGPRDVTITLQGVVGLLPSEGGECNIRLSKLLFCIESSMLLCEVPLPNKVH